MIAASSNPLSTIPPHEDTHPDARKGSHALPDDRRQALSTLIAYLVAKNPDLAATLESPGQSPEQVWQAASKHFDFDLQLVSGLVALSPLWPDEYFDLIRPLSAWLRPSFDGSNSDLAALEARESNEAAQ